MINTKDFKTKTEIIERKNISFPNAWPIAIDIGYGGNKGFCPNKVFRFPYFAKKIDGEIILTGNETDEEIYYHDLETGEKWAVGEKAINMIMSNDTNESDNRMYNRDRYEDPMFLVNVRVCLALGVSSNSFGSRNNKPIYIQTGLPPKYIKTDSERIKNIFKGRHRFRILQGNKDWKEYDIEIQSDRINVMPQPMGTLFSIASDNFGNQIPDAINYFKKRTLILDGGQQTFDTFNLVDGVIKENETSTEFGMRAVLKATCDKIYKQYQVEISTPVLLQRLETGTFKNYSRTKKHTELTDFSSILEATSKDFCEKAINMIDTNFNSLIDHDYLVITGGTGMAWESYIRESYAGMSDTLVIINGNQNDTSLPYSFNNVRGYYMMLCNTLKALDRKSA